MGFCQDRLTTVYQIYNGITIIFVLAEFYKKNCNIL